MPRKNHTPRHTRYVDTRPDCSHKRRYQTRDQALRAAELRTLESPGLALDIYQCERCGSWHLTSKQ